MNILGKLYPRYLSRSMTCVNVAGREMDTAWDHLESGLIGSNSRAVDSKTPIDIKYVLNLFRPCLQDSFADLCNIGNGQPI